MKRIRTILWAAAGGAAVALAVVWSGPGATGPLGANAALAQTTEQSAPAAGDGMSTTGENSLDTADGNTTDNLRGGAPLAQDNPDVSDSQWQQLMAFMDVHAPYRSQILKRQPPGPNSAVRKRLMQRWQNLQWMYQSHPEMYNNAVQEFEVQDQILGLAARLRRATRNGLLQIQANLKDQIMAAAGDLVKLNLQQRELALQNAKRLLSQQEASLNRDETNKDQLIQRRYELILQQADPAFRQQ